MERRSAALPARVERVRQRFERWRGTRERRGRIPEDLWSAAARLAEVHGVSAIAQALRLDYYSLKRRVATTDIEREEPADECATFVEVALDDAVTSGECTIELTDPAGFTMTLRGSSASDLDLPRLLATFLDRRQ